MSELKKKNIRSIQWKATLLALLLITGLDSLAQVVPHDKLPPKPNPARLVNDFANLLTDEEERKLEEKLVAYDDSTSNQILIVTVKTMHGYEGDQYATEIGQYWGVGGQSKNDNGVVVLVSDGSEEGGKRAWFIATGYGLEGALPAITCNAIGEQFLVPNLKSGDYYQAFDQTTTTIIKAAAGEYKPPKDYNKRKKGRNGGGTIIGFIVIIILVIIFSKRGGGGRGGGFMSRRGSSGLSNALWWMTILNSGRSGGAGSGWSGGGGSSGGGGFGGFGGGGFGGGGSGGSW